MPKQAEAIRNGVITNKITNSIYTENLDALKRYESTEVNRSTWLVCPRIFTGPLAVTLTKYLKHKKDFN